MTAATEETPPESERVFARKDFPMCTVCRAHHPRGTDHRAEPDLLDHDALVAKVEAALALPDLSGYARRPLERSLRSIPAGITPADMDWRVGDALMLYQVATAVQVHDEADPAVTLLREVAALFAPDGTTAECVHGRPYTFAGEMMTGGCGFCAGADS